MIETMLAPENIATAQDASVRQYRASERMLRHQARGLIRSNDPETADAALALAYHVGVEMVRNVRGSAPDEWEMREALDHDDNVREGWRK